MAGREPIGSRPLVTHVVIGDLCKRSQSQPQGGISMKPSVHAIAISLVMACATFLLTAGCDSTVPVSAADWAVDIDEADGLPFLIKSASDVPPGKVPSLYVACSAESGYPRWGIWVVWDRELRPGFDYPVRPDLQIPVGITWETDGGVSDVPTMYWDVFPLGEGYLIGMMPPIEWEGQGEFLEQLKASESVTVKIPNRLRAQADFDTTGFARAFEPVAGKCTKEY